MLCGLEESCGSHVEQILLMWDSVVLCGTEKSYVGQCSLMWDLEVLCGGEESYVEQNGFGETEHSRSF